MVKIKVATPNGPLFEEDVEIIIIRNKDGEAAIMQDHIPTVFVIDPGYIRLTRNDETIFVTLVGGFLEFKDNTAYVVAQEAEVGRDHENALEHLAILRKQRREENRKKNIDFTKAERDLKKNIRQINASEYT
ncbi:F0F1 ATP synthase subunit epsilon [Haloplasma contractile]|uniref:ATP synthase epsilon chain n=1 Tax=Haloplasma contractile SSD-17B TaxID=1033810 RepID=U2DSF3_9MOLU|nr:F0F1 ATP synthase subunit epsilon [Haloplasma contractile]ERJ11457.1 ATP synthase epsilon chain protein [Haloplasma contractile SSD-17B]